MSSTITMANPHGLHVGDYIEVGGKLMLVTVITATTAFILPVPWWKRLWFWIRRLFA